MENWEIKYERRIATMEESIRGTSIQIRELKDNQKILLEMNSNIKMLTLEYKNLHETIFDIETDLKAVNKRPGQHWEVATNALIIAVVSGTLGFFIQQIVH